MNDFPHLITGMMAGAFIWGAFKWLWGRLEPWLPRTGIPPQPGVEYHTRTKHRTLTAEQAREIHHHMDAAFKEMDKAFEALERDR